MSARLKRRGRIYYAWVPKREGGTRLVSTNCTDAKAAALRAAELERCAVDPAYAATNTTTVQRILDDYEASRKRLKRSAGTLHHVRTKAGHLLRVLGAETFARDLEHITLVGYIEQRQAEGARNTTILKELRVFGPAWKLARRNKLVTKGLDELMPELDDDAEPRTRWLTPWEVVGMALVLRKEKAAIVAFAVATGCDASALARVRREDVASDFSACRIRGTKRTTRDRVVPLPLDMQQCLLRWAVANAPGGLEGRLFPAWANVRRDLGAACKKLGIEHCSPNDLRRSYAKWLRNAGVEPALVGPAMGHKDGRMVERVYGKLTDKELAQVMAGRLSTVRLMSGGPVQTEATEGKGDSENAEESPGNSCAGAESNRRHGDFQSEPEARGGSRKDAVSAIDCTANVERSAPGAQDLAEEPPAPSIARQVAAGNALRRGVVKALARDEAGTLEELETAARQLAGGAP